MKYIELTQGKVAIIDDEDYEIISKWNWQAVHRSAKHPWYAQTTDRSTSKQKTLVMHRVITGAPTGMVVDHINGDGLDNRRCNLRVCRQADNVCNARAHRTKCSSIYKGVDRLPSGKWRAQIQYNKKKIILGQFQSEYRAAQLYNLAARMYHGEFARLNDIILKSS